ncbi:MAG: hypothetical protein H0W42_02150 [Gemmatimonadaceae bacterium]|nr:hypothetical protein [Gemmatimonadaceae bacterium]
MKIFSRTSLLLVLALAGVQATAGAQEKPKTLQDRNRIATEEVRAQPPGSVYQLIRARRGHWLTTRGLSTLQTRSTLDPVLETTTASLTPEIIVYVDNTRVGSQESLRSINTDEVDSLEYLNAQAATQRFGTGHGHGAILIRRRVSN